MINHNLRDHVEEQLRGMSKEALVTHCLRTIDMLFAVLDEKAAAEGASEVITGRRATDRAKPGQG